MTRTEFLNCYERDELEQLADEAEGQDDDNIDDHDLKATYYPDEH
jgi:hypothetical protein